MKFEHEFSLPLPIEQAWTLLNDIERIAPCMPGAQLTEVDGDSYKGQVKIRVGPITTQYKGTANILERDGAAKRLVLEGKGADSFGQGNAAAYVVGLLHDEGANTRVTIDTDLQISGKVAQLGQSVMKDVSSKLIGQFVKNLEKMLGEAPVVVAPQPATATPAPVAPLAAAIAPAPPGAPTALVPAGPADAAELIRLAGEAARIAAALASLAAGATIAPPPAMGSGPRKIEMAEPEAIDVLSIGGGAVLKRYGLILGVIAVIVIAILVYALR